MYLVTQGFYKKVILFFIEIYAINRNSFNKEFLSKKNFYFNNKINKLYYIVSIYVEVSSDE